MKRFLLLAVTAMCMCLALPARAEIVLNFGRAEKPFQFSPLGTLLIDGAVFCGPDKKSFPDGVAIPEVRLGGKLAYGNWSAKLEIGYAYGKVGLKDCYLQYDFNRTNFLRAGLMLHHFGYQNSTASCMKVTFYEPLSNSVFSEVHQIGVQYFHHSRDWYATAAVHAEPLATTVLMGPDQLTRLGLGARTRLVARPMTDCRHRIQVGISAAFATPQYARTADGEDPHDRFTFGANFPTKVVQTRAIESTVNRARNLWKLTPELMLNQGRVALEAQYFWMQVNRHDGLSPYRAFGAYGTLRGLLIGREYGYSDALAGIDTPAPGSLELALSYNHTSLSDGAAGIRGGRVNDYSATLSYYFNKFIVGKLHYSYTHTYDRAGFDPMSINAVQARLQLVF